MNVEAQVESTHLLINAQRMTDWQRMNYLDILPLRTASLPSSAVRLNLEGRPSAYHFESGVRFDSGALDR